MTSPMYINRKLLHATFPNSLSLEHPRRIAEVMDRKIEVPIINTNLKKKKNSIRWPFPSLFIFESLEHSDFIIYYVKEETQDFFHIAGD